MKTFTSGNKKPSHTPGPWIRNHNEWLIQEKDGALIACVYGTPDDEEQANAQLIAAAPDLLAAAQRVYREMADGDLTIGAMEDLAEAIGLATGEPA